MANPDRDRHPLLNLAYLLLASVLAGVVVAAVAFPAVGATGFAAKSGSGHLRGSADRADHPAVALPSHKHQRKHHRHHH